jgi:cytoskeleton protein RodZ
MNEAQGQGPASGFEPAAGADAPSAGTLLRLAREQAGLDVAPLAASLKVPVRKLEALEADRFDLLPDAVFVRALAASVCRTLKIDPAPILQRLPATGAPRLAPTEGGINAPFRSPRDGAGPSWRDQLTRPVVLVVAALLIAALVVFVLPSRHEEDTSQAVVPSTTVSEPVPVPVPAPEEAPVAAAPQAAQRLPAAPAPTPAPLTVAAPDAPATKPAASAAARPASSAVVATAPSTPVQAPAVPASASASVASGIVVFKAKAQSWVQVTDAKGGVPLRKLLAAGESAAASGPLPLVVTVGSVSATDVQVRGKPFDMAPVSRDNVARFEVK